MKVFLLIFIGLMISQVFVTPICYGLLRDEMKVPSEAFEQARLKKRRSTFIEEGCFFEADFGIMAAIGIVNGIRIKVSYSKSFHGLFPHFFGHPLPYQSCSSAATISLFLRNKVLRL